MSDSTAIQSVLIISEDTTLVESLISKNKSDNEFIARDSVQLILDDPSILETNSLIIYDVDGIDSDLKFTIDNILAIKKQDPTQILMVVGESNALNKILKSNIQPLIYRAFTKPISPNQIFLAFKSANKLHDDLVEKQAAGIDISTIGPAENRTNISSVSSERNNNSAIYAIIGVVSLAIVGWLLFSNQESEEEIVDDTVVNSIDSEFIYDEPILNTSDSVSRINVLNQSAANAMLDERVIAPKGDNALWYYDQVLAIDAYDTTAYQGKKNIADRLRISYNTLVSNAEFDRALKVINVLKRIEPLNIQNDALLDGLETSINAHVTSIQKSGSSEEIAKTTAVLERIGSAFTGSKSASEALQAEKALVDKIDSALDANILIPPAKNNAYSFVSSALKDNTISKANIEPRVSSLSEKLLNLANKSVLSSDLEQSRKLAALIKRLNVDRDGLALLNTEITKLSKSISKSSDTAKEEIKNVEPVPAKIIPAKIITRAPPRYPSKALNRNIDGWVKVRFNIDTTGKPINIETVESKPKGYFEKSALKAIENWRFSPARNEESGLAVVSNSITSKVNFQLDNN